MQFLVMYIILVVMQPADLKFGPYLGLFVMGPFLNYHHSQWDKRHVVYANGAVFT